MITRLYRSKSDIENLSRLKTTIPTGKDRYDYKKYVVNKPWGYEYLMFENKEVSIWILYLAENESTSMHCHPNKKTSLIVIRGEVQCSTLEGFVRSKEGEGLVIESSVFHATRAVSPGGAIIMEMESPPNKRDLVRLKDLYGREGKEYEGVAQMSRELHNYEYIDFHGVAPKMRKTVRLGTCVMSLCVHKRRRSVRNRIQRETAEVLCLLSGELHDHTGNTLLTAGEAVALTELKKISRIGAFHGIMYITISHRQSQKKVSRKKTRKTKKQYEKRRKIKR
jgi:mannose-6-phosphate isomerase-like protein (cupin superfamily)